MGSIQVVFLLLQTWQVIEETALCLFCSGYLEPGNDGL
jgi:hypothetical protein